MTPIINRFLLSCWLLLCTSVSLANPPQTWEYEALPGDTYQSVGERFLNANHNWTELVRLSSKAGELQPGTRLRIPVDWLKRGPATASVVSTAGFALYTRNLAGTNQPVKTSQPIQVGDRIRTTNGSVVVRLADGSILRIGPNSTVTFNRLSNFGDTGMVDTELRLLQGELENEVQPLNDPASSYEIHTPSAVAAVRGTSFRLVATAQSTQIEVTDGEVELIHKANRARLESGFGTRLSRSGQLSGTVTLPEAPVFEEPSGFIERLPADYRWAPVANANRYRYRVLQGGALGQALIEGETQRTQLQLANLNNGRYLLHMVAVSADNYQGTAAIVPFTVGIEATPAVLRSPALAAVVDNGDLSFAWSLPEPTDMSRLELARSQDFNALTYNSEFGDTNTWQPKRTVEPGVYHWRVATLAGGSDIAYSESREVSIRGLLPPTFIVSVQYEEDLARLFWRKLEQTDRYMLQIATDIDFQSIIREEPVQGNSASVRLDPGTAYYARVKGQESAIFSSQYDDYIELRLP